MDQSTWRLQLKSSKFQPLEPYFKGLDTSDLLMISPEQFIKACEPHDRLLMNVFVQKVLQSFLESEPVYDVPSPLDSKSKGKVLNLREKLLPVSFESLSATTGKVTLKNVVSFNKFDVVNLSNNNLMDTDVPLIADRVAKWAPSVLDISGNRIYGSNIETQASVDRGLRTILSNPGINFVVIDGNPIATVDRTDFFKSLSAADLEKLVWIPRCWVSAGKWKRMVEPSNYEVVEGTHERYSKLEQVQLGNPVKVNTPNN